METNSTAVEIPSIYSGFNWVNTAPRHVLGLGSRWRPPHSFEVRLRPLLRHYLALVKDIIVMGKVPCLEAESLF